MFGTYIFNPRHSSIVDICHVTGIDVVDSYLYLDRFVRIEYKCSKTNSFTMRVSQRWYVRYMKSTALKWKACQIAKEIKNKKTQNMVDL